MKVFENLLNNLPQPKDTPQPSRQGESRSAREVEMWLLFEQLWEDLYSNAEGAPSSSRQGGSQSVPEDKMWMQLEQLWEDLCHNPEQPDDGLTKQIA